jgi:hypothetical protein
VRLGKDGCNRFFDHSSFNRHCILCRLPPQTIQAVPCRYFENICRAVTLDYGEINRPTLGCWSHTGRPIHILNVGPARSTLRRKSGNFDLQSEKEWINEALVFILAVGIVFAGRLTQEFLWQLELLFRQFENPTAKLASHPCITDLSHKQNLEIDRLKQVQRIGRNRADIQLRTRLNQPDQTTIGLFPTQHS